MSAVQSDQVQTLVLSGMGKLKGSCLALLTIESAEAAKSELAYLTKQYDPFGFRNPKDAYVAQVAFSAGALRSLGIDTRESQGFDRAFCEGMTSGFRSRTLGDTEASAPSAWGWSDDGPAVALWVFAATGKDAEEELQRFLERSPRAFKNEYMLTTDRLPGTREHFGFRDGISNPVVPRAGQEDADLVGTGDFLFGYKDATGTRVEGPKIGDVNFGRHGSYLVLRQISQNVTEFWGQWLRAADGDEEKAIWLAAKAVGRWPNGMPLQSSDPCSMPDLVDSEVKPLDFSGDSKGLKCPFGSHIRRSSPREDTPEGELSPHRILRRGRVYGPVCDESVYPKGIDLEPNHLGRDSAKDRGIIFACLNTDIVRQFEFVQQTWINNPKFRGLHSEVDPIAGSQATGMGAPDFTVPAKPFRYRVSDVKPHVTTRGGGYFFLPGKEAFGCILR